MEPDSFAGRSVFVTGGYGLLGSWLVKGLHAHGARVTVLKRDAIVTSALELEGTERHVNVVRGDVGDLALMERVMTEYEVDSVFHLAAQSIVAMANRSPLSTFETNVRGTWIVLEACRRVGVQAAVVAASDKAYGSHEDLPYREQHALRPRYPYEVSKAATDMIARSYAYTYGLPVAVTRLANLYGGGDLNLSRLVPEAVLAAIDGRPPVIRSDGTLQRDFLYVEDAVAAYLAICGLVHDGRGAGEAFNAGGDRPHSVLEVVELACEVAGARVTPEVRGQGTPPGEIPVQWVDSAKLRGLSGWAPQVSLEDGLTRTVEWYRRHRAALP
ncbi:MAG TPA: NAD-dependent epimerase/dehydratase family protein [Solirubrobacteraceae bacterium]|jgi:CDP-glucose 4,6-dehydratase|nr:NAD-dependent epimerase/dehydratase family protein [Solirubrobacteraceae bacterium]